MCVSGGGFFLLLGKVGGRKRMREERRGTAYMRDDTERTVRIWRKLRLEEEQILS